MLQVEGHRGILRFVDATKQVLDAGNGDGFLPVKLHGVWVEFFFLVTIVMAT